MIIIIRRPTTDPFTTRQHIQALSMRNREQFAERMNAAAPVIEELAEVKVSTWRDMRGLFSSMEAVGRMNMLGNFTGRMQQAAMFPMNVLTTRLGFMLEGLMMPLMPVVNRAVMAYESFVMANQTGALIGGAIGAIVGSIVPYFGTLTGALIGAGIGGFTQMIFGWGPSNAPDWVKRQKEREWDPEVQKERWRDLITEDYSSVIVQDPIAISGSPGSRPRLPDGRVIRVI